MIKRIQPKQQQQHTTPEAAQAPIVIQAAVLLLRAWVNSSVSSVGPMRRVLGLYRANRKPSGPA